MQFIEIKNIKSGKKKMEGKRFVLVHDNARQNAARACMEAPEGYVVKIEEPTRTLDQNALLWPLLTDISKQVVWYGNKLTQEEWKHVFSASLQKQKVIPGLDGEFVVCGLSTRTLPKKVFSDLIELIMAFAVQQNVVFSNER